jgi:transcriptional regulator with XRE-family HTH domain
MTTVTVSIGAELYHRRLAAGLPIAQVARRVGVAPSFLAALERNEQIPAPRLADEIRTAILELSGGYWDPFRDEYLVPEPR